MARGGLRTTVRAYVRAMPDEDLAELLAAHRAASRPRSGRPTDNRPKSRPAWREALEEANRPVLGETDPEQFRATSLRGAALARRLLAGEVTPDAVAA